MNKSMSILYYVVIIKSYDFSKSYLLRIFDIACDFWVHNYNLFAGFSMKYCLAVFLANYFTNIDEVLTCQGINTLGKFRSINCTL